MRRTTTILNAAVALALLSVPSTLAQEARGVTGITLQAIPNAVMVSWQAPPEATVDHYTVYYSKQSILENNGRFDEAEQTLGDETSLVLVDLKNRGFSDGETLYVTVTSTDLKGKENATFAEEKSTRVRVPGTESVPPPHESAPTTGPELVILEQAVSENLTTVRLRFSAPVRIPADGASQYLSIAEEQTGTPVAVLSAIAEGQDIVLTTLTMSARTRYAVSVSAQVAAGTATFVARGEEGTMPPQGGPEPGEEIIVPPLLEIPPEVADRTPPEPPSDLVLKKILQSDGLYSIEASWEESLDTAEDLQSYNVYESEDRGKTFVGPTALRATVLSTTIANVPPGTLTVKVTAMDRSGNESEGMQETVILPETGPALTLLLSLAGAGVWTLRRRRV